MTNTNPQDLKNSNGECIDRVFPGWSFPDVVPDSQGGLFRIDSDSTQSRGCLVFNWEKKNQSNSWIGSSLRFVWTFVRGEEGFAVYLSGTVHSSNTMKWDGVSYAMRQEGGVWKTIAKRKLINDTLSFNSEKFPKINGSSFGDSTINKYWGFLDDQGSKVKDVEGNVNSRVERWEWFGKDGESTSVTLDDWTPNLNSWWRHFFGEDSKGVSADDLVKDVQGSWKKF